MVAIANDWDFAATNETANAILVRKTITAKAALAVGETALETAGGPGFHRDFGLERLLRDLHGSKFHPLAEKRQLLFSGRYALGLDPVGEAAAPRFQAAAE